MNHPVMILRPAKGTIRILYGEIMLTLASRGYTVVAIDAPYDADVIQYPDGSITTIDQTVWDKTNTTALAQMGYTVTEARVVDVSLILDSLSNTTLAYELVSLVPGSSLNTSRVAMFGYSLGGATAFSILSSDDLVIGGLNMDGRLYGSLRTPIRKPFMLMGRLNHTRNSSLTDSLLTWSKAWAILEDWKRDMIVTNALRHDFPDFNQSLFDTLEIIPKNESVRDALRIGPMGGYRTCRVATSYVGAFLDFVIHSMFGARLNGPTPQFYEVLLEMWS